LLCSVLFGKGFVAHLILLVDLCPFRFKCKSIDKVHNSGIRNILKHLGNHVIGFILHPVIDILECLLIKWRFIDICSIIIRIRLQEILIDGKAIIIRKPD